MSATPPRRRGDPVHAERGHSTRPRAWPALAVAVGCIVIVLMAVATVGCGQAASADKVIARVDGQPIYRSQLDLERKGAAFTQQKQTDQQLLNTLIDEELVRQQAVRLKLTVTPAEIAARLRLVEQQAGGAAALDSALKSVGLDRAGLSKRIAVVLTGEKVEDAMFGATKATRAQALAYYTHNLAQFRQPAAVRLAAIVVRNQAMARSVLTRLGEGQSFAATARQFSQDVESKDNGGQLGWIIVSSLPTPLAHAVAAMKPGAISRPVSVPGGVYIVKLLGRRPASVLSFSVVSKELQSQLTTQLRERALAAWVKDVRAGAKIEILH